jgi:hypothetical protein
MRLFVVPALIAMPTFFCAVGTSPTAPANIVIKVGSSTHASGAVVRFQRVVSDSRCPLNAACVWAGDAVAEFAVSGRGLDTRYEMQLNDAAKRTVNHRGIVIEFQSLEPLPVAGEKTDPSAYRARVDIR